MTFKPVGSYGSSMTDAPLLPTGLPTDSQHRGVTARLPERLRAFALLARFDRPIGWWLLFWPCAFAVALAGGAISRWPLLAWFLVGAIAMRGAGCVYNDIIDRDIDRQVARTAARPLASGAVSVRAALVWMALLGLIGLVVLLQLPRAAQLVALGSLLLVAAYPFMKRVTWWPQIWLGLVFSWGALVGWIALRGVQADAMWALYVGCVAWVIGYDTIYAVQDIEDDAIVGVRSSARALGPRLHLGVGIAYASALIGWGRALWLVRPEAIALVALAPVAAHLVWQVATLDRADGANALLRFRANRLTGLLAFAAFLVVGSTA